MASTPSSLVLGVATRLSPTRVEPFAHSLRATGYRGQLGLVLGQYGEAELRRFEQLADFVIPVDASYQRARPMQLRVLRALRETRRVRRAYPVAFRLATMARERNALRRWRALEYQLEGLQALRYDHYYDALRDAAPDAKQILLSDVRDVLFQRDPFEPPVRGLEVFLEEPHMTISDDWFTHRWMLSLYGAGRSGELEHEVTSCSGTVIGERAAMLHYLREMSGEIGWRRRPLGSHDQAVHNHLLRAGRLEPVTIVPNGWGRVLTMAQMAHLERDVAGRILNVDGSVPAVLHQYDRHPRLANELLASLGGSG